MKRIFWLTCLLVALASSEISAQTLTTLYSLGDLSQQEGIRPAAPLLLAPDGLLYGSTSEAFGAGIVRGTIFKMAPNGSNIVVLKQFTNALEGTSPRGRLVMEGDTLYGLTARGGLHEGGTVFRMKTNGSGFTVLASLPPGAFSTEPPAVGGLTLDGSKLYGATPAGGRSNCGTIFKLNTDGTDFAVLRDFDGTDGKQPNGDLLLSNSSLFGTTYMGGNSFGTIFRMDTNGGGFTLLRQFDLSRANEDGASPSGGLILLSNALYGATYGNTVFKINPDGTGFQRVLLLVDDPGTFMDFIGGGVVGTLAHKGETLYGVTSFPQSLAPGPRAFAVDINGSNFQKLGWTRAQSSRAGVTLVDNVPHGAAYLSDVEALRLSEGHIFANGGVVHEFTGYAGDGGLNSLTRSGGFFYGTTAVGRLNSPGTVFRVNANGTDFRVLYRFPGGANGETPVGRLSIAGTNIFGVLRSTQYEALYYRLDLDGRGYKILARSPTGPFFWGAGERPGFIPAPAFLEGRIYANAGSWGQGGCTA